MKKLFVLLLFVVANLAMAQGTCNGSAANLFNENFNSTGACVFGSGNTCQQSWDQLGGANSAYLTSAPTPNAPWGAYAAYFPVSASGHSIATQLNTVVPAGTTMDFCWEQYITTDPSTYSLFFYVGNYGVGYTASCFFSGANAVECQGTAATTAVTVSANASHLFHVHLASGAAASYFTVDGGTQTTFTENATIANFIEFGSTGDTAGAYYIGNVAASSTQTIAGPPTLVLNPAGTNTTTVTTTTAGTETTGGNGAWSALAGGFTYDTTLTPPAFLAPVSMNGSSFTGAGGSAWKFDCTTTNSAQYTWSTLPSPPNADVSGWFRAHLLSTDTTAYDFARISGSTDYVIFHEIGSGTSLEAIVESANGGAHNTGSIPLSPDVWYWYKLDYSANAQHSLSIYTSVGSLVGTILAQANNTSDFPVNVILGHGGGSACPATDYYEYGATIINSSGIDNFSKGPLNFGPASVSH